jgi:hypothetical protein
MAQDECALANLQTRHISYLINFILFFLIIGIRENCHNMY